MGEDLLAVIGWWHVLLECRNLRWVPGHLQWMFLLFCLPDITCRMQQSSHVCRMQQSSHVCRMQQSSHVCRMQQSSHVGQSLCFEHKTAASLLFVLFKNVSCHLWTSSEPRPRAVESLLACQNTLEMSHTRVSLMLVRVSDAKQVTQASDKCIHWFD
jgi:hypothetical protein